MAKSMISSERGKLGDPPSPPDDFGYLFVNNNHTVTIVKNVLLVYGDKRAGNRFILNWSLDLVMSALLFVHLACIAMRALPVQCQKNLRMRIRTPMV
ncbi:hypothetical protein Bca4012_063066 [Brassica carinata]